MSNYMAFIFLILVFGGMVFLHRELAAIHELANSKLTQAQADLAIADARIRKLEDHIAHEPHA